MESLFNILLFGGLIFLMMRFGCGSHMFGHNKKGKAGEAGGGCCGGDKKDSSNVNNAGKGVPPKQDTDPVCGNIVSTEKARTSFYDGLVYFFCSIECRETFEAFPEKYAEKDDGAQPRHLEHQTAGGGGHD